MDQALQMLIYLIIIALCLIILLPCLNVVALAFNDGADAARGEVKFSKFSIRICSITAHHQVRDNFYIMFL